MNFTDFERSQNVVFEMLSDRGYDVSKTDKIDKKQFEEMSEYIILDVEESDGSNISIMWVKTQLGINIVQKLALLESENIILITLSTISTSSSRNNSKNHPTFKPNISPMANEAIINLDKNIQIFCIDELKINITKHCLVPKHSLVSDEELEKLKKTYGDKTKYWYITSSDAIVKYYGWKRGQVIKIERKDNRIVYRTVV